MKKINDLKIKLNEKLDEMRAIVEKAIEENRTKNEDEQKRYTDLNSEVKTLESQIREYEELETLNKREVEDEEPVKRDEEKPLAEEFRDWLQEAVEGRASKKFEFRADPIITSTQSAIINKTVANKVDILTSPGEAFLRSIGVQFFTGLNGQFVVPALAEDTAEFVSEAGDASTSDMAHEALTLAPRRVSAFQSITKETLVQTNPAIYSSILQNLVNGIYKAVTYDVFDTLESDAATAVTGSTATGLAYADILQLEASIGGLNIGAGAYVTTPSVKAYLKGLDIDDAGIRFAWNGNEMNGYSAYGVPAANANSVYFGDFSRMAVGQWDGIELIVDPYTYAKQGRIQITAVAMFDTGCTNVRAFAWLDDVSAGW